MAADASVGSLLVNVETDVVLVSSKSGSIQAFVLRFTQRDGEGVESHHQIFTTPPQLQAICALLQETLHAQGHEIPKAPSVSPTAH